MKKFIVFFGVVIVAIAYVSLKDVQKISPSLQQQTTSPEEDVDVDVDVVTAAPAPLVSEKVLPAKDPRNITTEEVEAFRVALPDQDGVKREANQDPHATPVSIIKFATVLGSLMKKGLQNFEDAALLIDELNECALKETTAQSAKALCLSNAQKLSKTFPQLEQKLEEMRAAAPVEVLRLLERRNRLLKK